MGGKGPLAAPRGGHVGAAGSSPAPRGVLGSRELQDPAREGRGAGAAHGPRKLSKAAHLPSPQLIGRSESCDGGGRGRAVPQGPPWPPQRPSPHHAPGLSRALFLGLSRLCDTQVACSGRTSRRGGVSGRVATKSTHRAAQEIGGSQWAGTPPEASRVPMLVGRGGRGAGSRGSAAPVGSCATHVSSTRWQHPSSRPPAG